MIVPTKLRPPEHRGALVERPRLVGDGPPAPLVVVHAPAGYGKTSLLVQWLRRLESRGDRCGWLTIDEDDNQPPRLLLHLAAALLGDRDDRDEILARLVADLQLAPASLGRLLDALPGFSAEKAPSALFVDELEHLVGEASIGLLRRLVERIAPDCRLVLASRAVPNLGLGRLRLRGTLVEIGPEELRFGEDETAAFLSSRGFALPPGDIGELLARTEGWAAALQLTSLAIAGRRDASAFIRNLSGSYREIGDYLAEAVLDRQDPETRRFLLDTSILRRLAADLCDAVTRRKSSRAMLERLERAGLFVVNLDGERRWYRYHPLFARFLQERLARTDRRRPERLHRAAARWFSRRRLSLEAAHHALAAGDFELAASMMDASAKELNRQGQFSTVVGWARELPERLLDEHPAIRAAVAWAHLFHRDFDEADRQLARIARVRRKRPLEPRVEDDVCIVAPIMAGHRDRIADTLELSRTSLDRLRGTDAFNRGALRASLAYGLTAAGRFDEARAVLGEARGDHARSGSLLGAVYTLTLDGVIDAIRGNLSAAQALYEEAENLAGRGETSSLASIPLGYAAELLYERDHLDEAEARLDRHLALAVESAVVDPAICACLTAARVRHARGFVDEAARVLGEAERTGQRRGWPRLVAAVRWERIRFALRDGGVGEARALRRQISEDLLAAEQRPLRPHAGETEAQEIGELRLRIRTGEARRALPAIRASIRGAENERRLWRALRLRILEAEALDAVGDSAAALRSLGEALRRGTREGFIRSFADEGPSVTGLVRRIRDCGGTESDALPRSYLDAILRAAGEAIEPSAPGESSPIEALSSREREILALLAEGPSNRVMARRLFVSENTVKFHLKTIFAKLGVSNRVHAVAVARRTGLLA